MAIRRVCFDPMGWIWRHNPDGMFADMNPRIGDCP